MEYYDSYVKEKKNGIVRIRFPQVYEKGNKSNIYDKKMVIWHK